MDCPVCRTALAEHEVEGVSVLFCLTCGGLLCTRACFREYVAVLRESSLESLPTVELFERRAVPLTLIRPEKKACPSCGAAMAPFNYAYDSNIFLDRCPRCDLIWADRGEIVKVAQYVKGNPTLERLGHALADRETELAKYRDMADEAHAVGGQGRVPVTGFWIGLLPLSDEEETTTFPLVTLLLILVNFAVFMLFGPSPELFEDFGFVPDYFLGGRELHRLITSQFLHVSIFHLLGNMLFLWIFGDNVEDRFGKIAFLLIYLVLGAAGDVAHAFTTAATSVPAIGASGAISGVMGCYFLLFSQSRVRTVIGYYIVRIPAAVFLLMWLGLQVMFSLMGGPVAYAAHIGGFIAGMIVALAYKSRKRQSTTE